VLFIGFVCRLLKDDPGFTRIATPEEIRAKHGNQSIPCYVAPKTASMVAADTNAPYGSNCLTEALTGWLESSKNVRKALGGLLRQTHAESREKGA
jgi:type I restriction enzyme M protein